MRNKIMKSLAMLLAVLALAACVKGYKCIFVTTDKQSKEKVDILQSSRCRSNCLPYQRYARRSPQLL